MHVLAHKPTWWLASKQTQGEKNQIILKLCRAATAEADWVYFEASGDHRLFPSGQEQQRNICGVAVS